MQTRTLAGWVLIVLGIISLSYAGISYTRRVKVLDLGPIEATAEKRETIPLPPVVGVVALLAGAVLVMGHRSDSFAK